MKILLQFSPGFNCEEREAIRNRIVRELREDGVATVPSFCRIYVVEKDAEVSNDDS